MDDSVNHICNVIGVNDMTRSKMVQCGISTIEELMAITEDRNERSIRYKNEGGIRSDVFNNLLQRTRKGSVIVLRGSCTSSHEMANKVLLL